MTLTQLPLEDTIASVASAGRDHGLTKPDAERLMQAFARCDYDILRVKAIQSLRTIGASGSHEVLIAALHDDDEDVRVDAADALGRLGNREAVAPLIENLVHDPCADVKLSAIGALHALDGRESAPILRQLVTGRGKDVVWDEDEVFVDEWDGWLDIQIAAIEALGAFGDAEAIEPIIAAMNDPEAQNIDSYAMEAFRSIGEPALPTLAICARSDKRMRRLQAIKTASGIAGEGALKILKAALEDKDNDIRLEAFEAMLKRAPSVELFEAALEDNNELVRIAAYQRLQLDSAGYLDRALADPSPKVKLALIKRLSEVEFQNSKDPVFRALVLLSESKHDEVASAALAVLAVNAESEVKRELADLFDKTDGNPDARERRQWAVVDALAATPKAHCLDWLERATGSHSRSVRLKALTAIGRIVSQGDLAADIRTRGMALLESFSIRVETDTEDSSPAEHEPIGGELAEGSQGDESEEVAAFSQQNAEDIAGMKAAGLDLGDERDQTEGPTSSLGAILGHEAIARDLIAEAESEVEQAELSMNEQALLNQARRNLSRRKIDLDGDAEQIDREIAITAIQLLGDHSLALDHLLTQASSNDPDICAAALESLSRILPQANGLTEDRQSELEHLLVASLSSAHTPVRQQAMRVVSVASVSSDQLAEQIGNALTDEQARIRLEAIKPHLALGGSTEILVPMLDDDSSMVRQAAMRHLADVAPDLAVERIVDFLIENPEQSLAKLLGQNAGQKTREQLASVMTSHLNTTEQKAKWGILLTALADCFPVESHQMNGAAA